MEQLIIKEQVYINLIYESQRNSRYKIGNFFFNKFAKFLLDKIVFNVNWARIRQEFKIWTKLRSRSKIFISFFNLRFSQIEIKVVILWQFVLYKLIYIWQKRLTNVSNFRFRPSGCRSIGPCLNRRGDVLDSFHSTVPAFSRVETIVKVGNCQNFLIRDY